MIRALFDDSRRRAIQAALLSGKPIRFRGKDVVAEHYPQRLERIGIEQTPVLTGMGSGIFTGTISLDQPVKVGDIKFWFSEAGQVGWVSVDEAKMGICRGDDRAFHMRAPVGQATGIDWKDGRRAMIEPAECFLNRVEVRITVGWKP